MQTQYQELLKRMEEVLLKIKALEEEKAALGAAICTMVKEGLLTQEDLLHHGLTYATRRNGYEPSIIPFLKQKGLRDAIVVEEKVINKMVDMYVKAGLISKEEISQYEKPISEYISLARSKN